MLYYKRRDDREAEGGCLLSNCAGESLHRGFESLSLRQSEKEVAGSPADGSYKIEFFVFLFCGAKHPDAGFLIFLD